MLLKVPAVHRFAHSRVLALLLPALSFLKGRRLSAIVNEQRS